MSDAKFLKSRQICWWRDGCTGKIYGKLLVLRAVLYGTAVRSSRVPKTGGVPITNLVLYVALRGG